MSRISTHVLNTVTGKPAAGVRVHLYSGEEKVNSDRTNSDGRCPNLLPDNLPLKKGDYSIQFETDGLFDTCFYPRVTIEFRISSDIVPCRSRRFRRSTRFVELGASCWSSVMSIDVPLGV